MLDLLAGLVDAFERAEFARTKSTPRERLQFLLDENGLKAVDIAEIMGNRGNTSLVLSGKREISKEQARKLGERFGVPPARVEFCKALTSRFQKPIPSLQKSPN